MSPRCHGNIMWMIELAMKTKTAETRIGMQSDITGTMTVPPVSEFHRRIRRTARAS
jgi:hypothetical protein